MGASRFIWVSFWRTATQKTKHKEDKVPLRKITFGPPRNFYE
jgi:hypothetical protein